MLARCYAVEVGSSPRARRSSGSRPPAPPGRWRTAFTRRSRRRTGSSWRSGSASSSARSPSTVRSSTTSRCASLSGAERTRLKDSFRAIREWQEKATYHYQTDLV